MNRMFHLSYKIDHCAQKDGFIKLGHICSCWCCYQPVHKLCINYRLKWPSGYPLYKYIEICDEQTCHGVIVINYIHEL